MIRVRRKKDGKIFTSNMDNNNKLSILEIHFCTSYTQVLVQDLKTKEKQPNIICPPVRTKQSWIDTVSVMQDCDEGRFV